MEEKQQIEEKERIEEMVQPEGSLMQYAKGRLQLRRIDIRTYSPLTLAYIGDSIFDLIIRTIVVNRGNAPANTLHKKCSSLVKAAAQAEMLGHILGELTAEERAVYKRGRNANSKTMAKNATMMDYRTATGLEALMGYLYLTEQGKRMIDLMELGLRRMGELT